MKIRKFVPILFGIVIFTGSIIVMATRPPWSNIWTEKTWIGIAFGGFILGAVSTLYLFSREIDRVFKEEGFVPVPPMRMPRLALKKEGRKCALKMIGAIATPVIMPVALVASGIFYQSSGLIVVGFFGGIFLGAGIARQIRKSTKCPRCGYIPFIRISGNPAYFREIRGQFSPQWFLAKRAFTGSLPVETYTKKRSSFTSSCYWCGFSFISGTDIEERFPHLQILRKPNDWCNEDLIRDGLKV